LAASTLRVRVQALNEELFSPPSPLGLVPGEGHGLDLGEGLLGVLFRMLAPLGERAAYSLQIVESR
jgi:hypothetical protein